MSFFPIPREHEANKKSTRQGNLAADFELSFNNQSKVRSSVYNLFSMVQDGALDGIPVKEGSLFVQGLKNVTWQKHEHRSYQQIVQGLLCFVCLFFVVVVSSICFLSSTAITSKPPWTFPLTVLMVTFVHKRKNPINLKIKTMSLARVINLLWFYESH